MNFFICLYKSINLKFLLYSCVILILAISPNFAFSQFITKRDAIKVSEKCYKVTDNKLYQNGLLWWKDKIDLTKPLELNFILYLGTDDEGADGIAFLFHNDPRGLEAKGVFAGGLGFGYGVEDINGTSIKPSVAIEFDTHNNDNPTHTWNQGFKYGDIPEDHTTVVYNGNVATPEFPPVWIDPTNPDVENNTCHEYKITWNPAAQELKLFVDGNLRFNHKDDIINKVFNGNPVVYYGFTGSTGGRANEQTICLLDPNRNSKPIARNDVANTEPTKPVTIEVTKNDSHTTGEQINLTRIINGPQNGSVIISGQNIVYTSKVGFTGTDSFTYEISEVDYETCYATTATATVTVTVTCKTFPETTVVADGPTEICPGRSVKLTASPGYSYKWSNGATTQSITVNQAGSYSVKLQTASGCESSSPETRVTLAPALPAPTITASGPTIICGSGNVKLAVPQQTGVNYQWEKDGQQVGGNSHSFTATETGEYLVRLYKNCDPIESANKVKVVVQSIPPQPTATDSKRCGPGSLILIASGGSEGEYRWYSSLTATTPLNVTESRFNTPIIQNSTTYYVSSFRLGCESTRVPVQAIITSQISASAGPNVTIDLGESIRLQASGGESYQWIPQKGLSNPNIPNPIAQPEETTIYKVIVTNAAGCRAEAQVTVNVQVPITIPNAFSPNGDGVNETWEIANIEKYPAARVEIYDRWGSKIYDTTRYRNNWNGTFKGTGLPVGTYFYVITLESGRKFTGPVSIVY